MYGWMSERIAAGNRLAGNVSASMSIVSGRSRTNARYRATSHLVIQATDKNDKITQLQAMLYRVAQKNKPLS